MKRRMIKPQKKSETLEIRIPHDTKQALMDRSRAEGKPTSVVIRTFIDAYLARTAPPPAPTALEIIMAKIRANSAPSFAALAAIVAVGTVSLSLVSSPASANPDLEAAFKNLDANGDGMLDMDEFGGGVLMNRIKRPASREDIIATPIQAKTPEIMFVMQAKVAGAGKSVVFAISVPSSNVGGVSGEAPAGRFARVDRDKDGSLSFEEFKANHDAAIGKAFAAVDIDRDGYLSVAEIGVANRRRSEASAILTAFDRDADRKLSLAEFTARD